MSSPKFRQAGVATQVAFWTAGVASAVCAWALPTLTAAAVAAACLVAWAVIEVRPVPWTALIISGSGLVCATLSREPVVAIVGIALLAGAYPSGVWLEQLRRRCRPSVFLLVVAAQPAAAMAFKLHFNVEELDPIAQTLLQYVFVASALLHAGIGLVRHTPERATLSMYLSQASLAIAGAFSGEEGRLASTMMLIGSTAGFVVLHSIAVEVAERFHVNTLAPDNAIAQFAPELGALTLAMGWLFVGLPGGITFFAEDALFHALFTNSAVVTAGFFVAGGLNAITLYRMYIGMFSGVARPGIHASSAGVRWVHLGRVALTLFVALLGIFPFLFF